MSIRLLLHPGVITSIVFLWQFLFWFLFMPAEPTLPGAAPRYESFLAWAKWLILFLLLELGILLGSVLPLSLYPKGNAAPINTRVRFWWQMALFVLLVSGLGEFVYLRDFVVNPELFSIAIEKSNFAVLGELARSRRIIGLSSLNNLFLLASVILASLAFHPVVPAQYARRARLLLFVLAFFVFLHSVFFAARMFFIYYLLGIVAVQLTLWEVYGRKRLFSLLKFVGIIVAAMGIIWLGELLRGGLTFARIHKLPLLSMEVQVYVWDRLVQGYLAADFNNALVILDCQPSMQLVSTTSLSFLLKEKVSYKECPGWMSSYGTANVFSLWWYDWGWGAFLLSFAMGFVLGLFYRMRLAMRSLVPSGYYYALAYPGLFSSMRINYYYLTIFLLPFFALVIIHIVWLAISNHNQRLGYENSR